MNTHQYKFERESPSFSSTLLDVIYRSIDERQGTDTCFQVNNQNIDNVARRNEKLESKFAKTNVKASSPRGRLKSFLASFFSNEKGKKSSKSKIISCTCRHTEVIKPKPKSVTCSTTSSTSFSRNKTTSCGVRKSVRFNIVTECPVVINNSNNAKHHDDDDDDDDMSCSSSDLFELDNLSDIGMDGLCMHELPLYETTNVDVNRAIANGLIV